MVGRMSDGCPEEATARELCCDCKGTEEPESTAAPSGNAIEMSRPPRRAARPTSDVHPPDPPSNRASHRASKCRRLQHRSEANRACVLGSKCIVQSPTKHMSGTTADANVVSPMENAVGRRQGVPGCVFHDFVKFTKRLVSSDSVHTSRLTGLAPCVRRLPSSNPSTALQTLGFN